MKGYINSFTDFFYLTHRHDTIAPSSHSPSSSSPSSLPPPSPSLPHPTHDSADPPPLVRPSSVAIPSSSLPVIASHLSLAESSHRLAVPGPIFSSYAQLSSFFSSLHDYKTAIYFQEKILELAETLSSHSHTALTALAALGSLYERMDQPRVAITYFERCGAWAKQVEAAGGGGGGSAGDDDLVRRSRQQLVRAYERHAGEHERAGDWAQALSFYQKCLEHARDTRDADAEMSALYHRALIAAAQSDPASAVSDLQAALALSRQLSHPLECPVLVQLALTYQAQAELNLCVQYLEEAYAVAVRLKDEAQQGEVMGRLGEVYSMQGEHREGMRMFERCYELAKKNGDRRAMDVARINVGKSRGNVFVKQFMALMEGDEELQVLMNWKTKRQGLKIGG